MVQKELDTTKQQLEYLVKQHQEMVAKSKADIKVLVKEVKSLRSSEVDLKQKLHQSLNEKSEAEVVCSLVLIRLFIYLIFIPSLRICLPSLPPLLLRREYHNLGV